MITEAPAPPLVSPVSPAYRRYALTVLLIIYVLNFLDRQIVSILAEPIKNELHLADWQLGVMTGLSHSRSFTRCSAFRSRALPRRAIGRGSSRSRRGCGASSP